MEKIYNLGTWLARCHLNELWSLSDKNKFQFVEFRDFFSVNEHYLLECHLLPCTETENESKH